MKKIIALVLAVVMTMGLASVAFAAGEDGVADYLFVDANSKVLKSVDGVYVKSGSLAAMALVPGTTYYIELQAKDGDTVESLLVETPTLSLPEKVVNKAKVFADWSVGSIGSFDIELKKVNVDVDETDADAYRYVIVFKTDVKSATTGYDVAGSIKVAESATKAKTAPSAAFGATIAYGVDDTQNGSYTVPKTGATVINFNDADELVDINFGDLALFEANVSGQGNLNLAWNTTFNSEFAAKYDYANIDFISWTKAPVFNRTGDLYIYAEEDTFIYEVTANGAKEIKKCEYDDAYGAWKIRTRKLGSYAISDVELKAEEVKAPVVETVKPNPNTGR